MNAELQRLIDLQRIDSAVRDAEERIAHEPEFLQGLDARLDIARERVAAAKAVVAASQDSRRAAEKELAVHQGRLSKYRDQLMAVKTNVEYQAMQKEIEFAQGEVRTHEEKILVHMLEADELNAAVKAADAELAAEQKVVDAEKKRMNAELGEVRQALAALAAEREAVIAALDKGVLSTFNRISERRHGVAVAEARDGLCTSCHVRLRPQVFNTVRRNDDIIQCDHCQRILYFVPPPPAPAEAAAVPPAL